MSSGFYLFGSLLGYAPLLLLVAAPLTSRLDQWRGVEMLVGEPLGDEVAALYASPTFDERWAFLTNLFRDNGFDQINYAVLNTRVADRAEASVTQYSTMDRGWINHYLDSRLDLSDPHVRFVRDFGYRPYYFDASLAERLCPAERNVLRQAAEAGLRSQISVIFPGAPGEAGPTAGMTIGSSLDGADFRGSIRGREQQLIALAMIFHNLSIADVRQAQLDFSPLTARERDCLSHVAAGLRVGRIAERMKVSEVTVELHLRNARRKLGAATTPHAVALAILAGQLNL